MIGSRITPRERPHLLGLLEGRRSLWALIATWPNVPHPEGWRESREGRRAVMCAWSRISGMPEFQIRHVWRMLFDNGFVREDGSVDPAVDAYVQDRAVEGLPSELRRIALAQIEQRRGGCLGGNPVNDPPEPPLSQS